MSEDLVAAPESTIDESFNTAKFEFRDTHTAMGFDPDAMEKRRRGLREYFEAISPQNNAQFELDDAAQVLTLQNKRKYRHTIGPLKFLSILTNFDPERSTRKDLRDLFNLGVFKIVRESDIKENMKVNESLALDLNDLKTSFVFMLNTGIFSPPEAGAFLDNFASRFLSTERSAVEDHRFVETYLALEALFLAWSHTQTITSREYIIPTGFKRDIFLESRYKSLSNRVELVYRRVTEFLDFTHSDSRVHTHTYEPVQKGLEAAAEFLAKMKAMPDTARYVDGIR